MMVEQLNNGLKVGHIAVHFENWDVRLVKIEDILLGKIEELQSIVNLMHESEAVILAAQEDEDEYI
jgi:hypothetical protein